MLDELWESQVQAVTGLRASIRAGARRPIVVSPTGSGKTHIAVHIIEGALAKQNKVLFLAPRRELIYQAADRLENHQIECGIIMAGERRSPYEPVQIASFDTLHSRGMRNDRILMPEADLVIVDEAHLSIAKTRQDIIRHYGEAIVVGLTATPARGDGRGLGELYDDLVLSWSIKQLTDAGKLVPARYFAPSTPDLSKIKQTSSDYNVSALGHKMDNPKLVGDIVQNWKRIAPERQTVVFCVTKAHARHVHNEFVSSGISAGYLDSDTPLDERYQILKDIESGKIRVLVNIFVATFGWDCPPISCVVIARPTKNIALYLQTVGRGLRTCDRSNKRDCIIIDHSGAVAQHGFVDEYIPWTLDSNTDIREAKKKQQKEKGEPKEMVCSKCQCVFKATRACPRCGYEVIPKGKPVPTHQADLEEIRKEKAKENREATWEEKAQFMGELRMYCQSKGKNPGWVAHKYRAKFGVWPNDARVKEAPAKIVTPETMSWITSQNIAYAKRREA